MGFKDTLKKKLDAHRLQQTVKATVQANGRLTFTVEATKEMELSEEKSLVIFEADDGNLGAIISHKGDPEAFGLKKCGQYVYVTFKNYLQQAGIDYKKQRILYDITKLNEEIEGKTLYKFERRVLPKAPGQLPYSGAAEDVLQEDSNIIDEDATASSDENLTTDEQESLSAPSGDTHYSNTPIQMPKRPTRPTTAPAHHTEDLTPMNLQEQAFDKPAFEEPSNAIDTGNTYDDDDMPF